jgi:multiple sugar transport system substrate-binding protein
MVFGDAGELQAYTNLVNAFESSHPAIRIELLHIPGQAEYRRRLALDLAGGLAPDVVLLNYQRYAPFAASNALEPLGPYLARSVHLHEADFYPQALDAFRWKRQLLCLPQNVSGLMVYYNKDLFDAARLPYPADDWTRDEFLAVAQALTRDLDGDGQIDQYGLGLEPSLSRLAPFVWQNSGSLLEGVVPRSLGLSQPPAQQALRWFAELQTRHHVVPDAATEAAEDSESRFLNGRTAMFINTRRGVPGYRRSMAFVWDTAPLPRHKVGRRANLLYSEGYCMTASAQDKDAAWAFIEFASSIEGQTLIAAAGYVVPSLMAVAESPTFLDPGARPQNSRAFLDEIPYLRRTPLLPHWDAIEEIASGEIKGAFYGQITVAEAARAAEQQTQDYFLR